MTWRSLYPFESRFVEVNGWRCHYVDQGGGPPVLFVHGNPTWSFLWRELIGPVAQDHRAIAVDHIGMGLSAKPARHQYPFSLSRRIADLEAFIDSLQLAEPLSLVVHDWGGPIGLGWAARHPDRVAKIVVTNSWAFQLPTGESLPWQLALARSTPIRDVLVRYANAFVRGAVELGVTGSMPRPVVEGYLAPYDAPRSRIAVLEFIKDIPMHERHRSYDALAAVDRGLGSLAGKDITILWGGCDFVFDARILGEWRRRFPDAHVTEFDSAGHFVVEDAGGRVLEHVMKALI